jgi:phosphatidate cytidylyltransferase
MNDLRFWGMVAALLIIMLAVTFTRPYADRLIKRPISRAVLLFIQDRERNGWLFLFAFWAAVVLHPGVSLVMFAFVSFLGLREFLTRTPANAADYRALFVSFFILLPVQYIIIASGSLGLFAVFIPVYAFFLLPSLSALAGDTKEFFARAAKLQLGVMLAVYCISHIPVTLMLTIKGWSNAQNHSAWLMLFLMLVTQAADIAQYWVSRQWGKRRVARDITRDLTWEGIAVGMVVGVLVGMVLYWYVPFNFITTIGVAAATCAAGFMGELVLGGIKRSTGVRDWPDAGTGRSSVLDRLAPLCFAAPVFYHLTRTFTQAQ